MSRDFKAEAVESVQSVSPVDPTSITLVLAWITQLGKELVCQNRPEIEDAADAAVEALANRMKRPLVAHFVRRGGLYLVDAVLDEMCGEDTGDED